MDEAPSDPFQRSSKLQRTPAQYSDSLSEVNTDDVDTTIIEITSTSTGKEYILKMRNTEAKQIWKCKKIIEKMKAAINR